MITVTVDGKTLNANIASLRSIGELVELVKATIDPDTIITSLKFDGHDLSENDWRMPLSAQGDKSLQITTGSRAEFLKDRLTSAVFYLDGILKGFQETSQALKVGDIRAGNTSLQKAVEDLRAFFNWYGTLMEMLPPGQEEHAAKFKESIKSIGEVCEQLLQQQLYRAWWAVAETIETKLAPQLTTLRGSVALTCEKV